jgi:zinc transport system substrate-binding protein
MYLTNAKKLHYKSNSLFFKKYNFMKQSKALIITIFTLVVVVGLSLTVFALTQNSNASSNQDDSVDPEKITVVTTFYPLTQIVEAVAGDEVNLVQLETGDVHSFEPTFEQLTTINDADLVIYNGLELEPWVEDLENSTDNSEVNFVNASNAIDESVILESEGHTHDYGDEEKHSDDEHSEDDYSKEEDHSHDEDHDHSHEGEEKDSHSEDKDHMHSEEEGHMDEEKHSEDKEEHSNDEEGEHSNEVDPHVWLDPELYALQVVAVTEALSQADTDKADIYTQNAETFTSELQVLSDDFAQSLEGCSVDKVIVSHDVLGYMASRYGFETKGFAGIDPSQEAGAAEIAEIVEIISAEGIETILLEPGVSESAAEAVIESTDGTVLTEEFYSLETVDDESLSYLDYMNRNLEALQTALKC